LGRREENIHSASVAQCEAFHLPHAQALVRIISGRRQLHNPYLPNSVSWILYNSLRRGGREPGVTLPRNSPHTQAGAPTPHHTLPSLPRAQHHRQGWLTKGNRFRL